MQEIHNQLKGNSVRMTYKHNTAFTYKQNDTVLTKHHTLL